ncbi:cytochrome P450 [Amycolatopsis anabasis]|uniref:cytochrome P450 n=1 Tax=Amycolatopsis anabasis TaxID=1840409 RepID=UPI00131E1FC1|nr:cytochrome P450 [Amycolatopsis anabasis]
MTGTTRAPRTRNGLPRASVPETVRFGLEAGVPLVAGGVIVRRPQVMALAEKLQADRKTVGLMHELNDRYGPGSLRVPIPGRTVLLVLDPGDVHRILVTEAASFTPANQEKRAALTQFQPHGVLISRGAERAKRREFNENVLQTPRPLHELAEPFVAVVREEADRMTAAAEVGGRLSWSRFADGWWRIVRRVVLGDSARDDEALTDELGELRTAGNWSYLHPIRRVRRSDFAERLRIRLDRAEPGSLAQALAQTPAAEGTDPGGQVPHWLFAFDAAGIVTARTLALLATHPEQAGRAHAELDALDLAKPQLLRYLRACQLESLRLWPTTPVVLRDSTVDTKWGADTVPAGAAFVILAPYFHRDASSLSYADEFAPDIWLDGRAEQNPALVPFSAGPGECPARNLVLFVTSTLLAALQEHHRFELTSAAPLGPGRPIPATLNNFALDFAVARR